MFTDPTQTQKSKFCFLGEGAGSGSPVHTERAPAYSSARDRDNYRWEETEISDLL